MKKSMRKFLVLVLLLVLLAIPAGVAFAKELGAMTITGPGIKGELTLKDPDLMRKLETSGFLEPSKSVKAPENPGEGYLMTLFLNVEDGLQPWLQVTYYPKEAGNSGTFHLVDLLDSAQGGSKGQWYQLSPKTEMAVRDLLVEAGVSLAVPQIASKEARAVSAPQVDQQKVVAAPKLEKAEQAAPAQQTGTTRAGTAMNPMFVLGISLSVALLLVFLSIRWLVTQRKINA